MKKEESVWDGCIVRGAKAWRLFGISEKEGKVLERLEQAGKIKIRVRSRSKCGN